MTEKKTATEQYKSAAKIIAKELLEQDNDKRQVTFQNHLNEFRESINEELLILMNEIKLKAQNRKK